MRFLNSLSLSIKIGIIAAIAVVTFIATLAVNLYGINKTNLNLDRLSTNIYPLIKLSNENSLQIQRIEEQYSQAVATAEEELVDKARATYDTIKQNIKKIKQLDVHSLELLNTIGSDLEVYQTLNIELAKAMMVEDIDFSTITKKAQQKSNLYDSLTSNILLHQNNVDELSRTLIDTSIEQSRRSIVTSLIIGMTLLVIMLLIAFIVTKVIVNSAKNTAESLADLASGEGDLSHQLMVNSNDELGQVAINFNRFMNLLKSSITDVISVAKPLTNISQVIEEKVSNVNDLNQRLSTEAETVKTSMLKMQQNVTSISQGAINAADTAQQAQTEVGNGLEVILDSAGISKELNDEVKTASEVVNELAQDAQNVNVILDVIRSIAEQTNLLALNAAIEAARAGEQGRGFAVVADEVRTLASRTSDATNEIRELVTKLGSAAEKSVASMEIATQKSKSNTDRTISASESLSLIKEQVASITTMNAQISSDINEQTVFTDQVLGNSTEMSNSLFSTLSNMSEIEEIAKKMTQFSDQLHQATSQFKL